MSLQLCARSSMSVSRASVRSLISSVFSKPAPAASLLHASPPSALVSRSLFHRALSSVPTLYVPIPGKATSLRVFSTRPVSSSLNDANPNWSNRPPKETILLDGCDFEHWLVVMEKPEGDPTRAEIIDSYIKTLAMVVGSEEEARMKIYSVSTRCYFAFGALVSEELSYKLKELPRVRWVLPDSYLNVKEKDYGGEPFINGEAVPYDPKYHEEWERNNQRAMERNRRNDRPRNTDRSRNFNRNRNMQYQDTQIPQPSSPMANNSPPNQASYQQHNTPPPNTGGFNQNQGGYQQYNSPPTHQPQHNSPPPHQQMHNSPPPNQPPYQPNQGGYPQSNMMPPNQGRYPPNNGNQRGYPPQNNTMPPNQGGYPPNQNGYQQNQTFPPNQGGYQQNYNARQNFQNGPPSNPPNPTWNNNSPRNYQDGYSPNRD